MKKQLLAAAVLGCALCATYSVLAQSLSFTTNNIPLPAQPRGVAVADFNLDGKMDIVFADLGESKVLIFTNNGGGVFGSNNVLLSVGSSPNFVATADVNNDGKPDIISTDATDGRLVVFTNNGAGGFSQSFSNALGFGLFSVAVADINNDGRLDLITAGQKQVVFTNAGNGVFGSNATLTVPAQSISVVARDIDNNGKVDLIFADTASTSLVVLTNNGAGVFGSNATIHISGNFPSDPGILTAYDINGDGKIDLLCGANSSSTFTGSLTILTNNGSGSFALKATVTLPLDTTISSLLVQDMNGDGKPDVVTVGYNYGGPPPITVLTNDGAGGLSFCTSVPVDANAFFASADINNDGRPDLIVADSFNFGLTTYIQNPSPMPATGFAQKQFTSANGTLSIATADINNDGRMDVITADSQANGMTVLTNDGSGKFGTYATLNTGSFNQPFGVAAADLNNDGKVDVVSANFNGGTITIYTNNGAGFGSNTTISLPLSPSAHQPFAIAAADLNNDGKADLVTVNWAGGPGNMDVLYNNGSGGFSVNATLAISPAPKGVIAADINNDGKLDLIAACSTALVIYTNRGASFGLSTNIALPGQPLSVVAADVNLDGKLDLITANFASSNLSVLTNNGIGFFVLSTNLTVGWDPASVVAADINGDGKVDLISADHDGNTLTVYTNNGSGGFGLYATIYLPGLYPGTILAADVNRDGKLDLLTANQLGSLGVFLQTVVPPPVLNIAPTGSNAVVVSWSSLSTAFAFQTNSTLDTNWQSSGLPVSVANGTNQSVTVSSPASNLFFRLKQ